MAKRQIRTGRSAQIESGWRVLYLTHATKEAKAFLTGIQYEHDVQQFRALSGEPDPTHAATADVRPIESFHELRDKGGVLGKINVRVYFGIDKTHRAIVIPGAVKKEDEGRLALGTRQRMSRRWRRYQRGEYGTPN